MVQHGNRFIVCLLDDSAGPTFEFGDANRAISQSFLHDFVSHRRSIRYQIATIVPAAVNEKYHGSSLNSVWLKKFCPP